MGLPWTRLDSASDSHRKFSSLGGQLAAPNFADNYNEQADWADALEAMTQLGDGLPGIGPVFLVWPSQDRQL